MSKNKTYSFINDFNSQLDGQDLQDEIAADNNMNANTFQEVSRNLDDICICFTNNLTSTEITALDSIVLNHSPTTRKTKMLRKVTDADGITIQKSDMQFNYIIVDPQSAVRSYTMGIDCSNINFHVINTGAYDVTLIQMANCTPIGNLVVKANTSAMFKCNDDVFIRLN